MRLPQKKVLELHAAAMSAGLTRAGLLVGIHPGFVASLRIGSSPSEQLLLDLAAINGVERLTDGSVPLRAWLGNAVSLLAGRPESQVFAEALRLVGGEPDAVSTPVPQAAAPAGSAQVAQVAQVAFMPAPGAPPARAYVSVAPEDEPFAVALTRHLAGLVRRGLLALRTFKDAPLGANVPEWIAEQLEEAALIVLLVSPDAVSGDRTYAEMEQALALRERKGTHVMPVLVRAVALAPTPIAGLTCFPRSGTPIAASDDADQAYAEIASDIAALVA
jgi:hypothetical protein